MYTQLLLVADMQCCTSKLVCMQALTIQHDSKTAAMYTQQTHLRLSQTANAQLCNFCC